MNHIDLLLKALAESKLTLLAERDVWRLMALEAIRQMSELTRSLEMIDSRRYTFRQRTAERESSAAVDDRQDAA